MTIEILLTISTLIVAVIGTLWKDPSRDVKLLLIGVAAVVSILSIWKSVSDESERKFARVALVSTLAPSNSTYEKLADAVSDVAAKHQFDDLETFRCPHSADGMSCFLFKKDKSKRATLVFNKSEIGNMYANQLSGTANASLIEAAFKKTYAPGEMNEEFLDKVGVLGQGVFFTLFRHFPSDYNYDEKGVVVEFEDAGQKRMVNLSKDELQQIGAGSSPDLFYALELAFDEKYKNAGRPTEVPTCNCSQELSH